MIEKVYSFTLSDDKVIEQVISDDLLDFNHVVLNKGERLPLHVANTNAYLAIIRGEISTQFNGLEQHTYPAGSIVNVPYKTKMDISNQNDGVLEFFVVKTPSPRDMK